MKAIIKKEDKPGLWMEDVSMPVVGENDVLIKVKKSSICGTDLHIYNWDLWAKKNIPLSTIVGHEFVGQIEELGQNVKNLSIGQRVSGEGHVTCGRCNGCRKGMRHLCSKVKGIGIHTNGCYAEYMVLPAENVFPLAPGIKDDIAAIFDPYGNAVHTAFSFPVSGEDVLITGAGPIGIMAAAIAKKTGARTIFITDINPYRLELAREMGATHPIQIDQQSLEEAMREAGVREGFSVGMEMSGNPLALNTLVKKAQHGGSIALLGLLPPSATLDWDEVIFKMLTLKGIYGREIFKTWHRMEQLLESGLNLDPIITHHFSAEDFEKGFQAMKKGQCGKVILDWE